MRFVFDNNIPPSLAHALRELTVVSARQHSVIHLGDLFKRNTQDIVWIEALSRERDQVVVTQDRLNKGLEREALRRAGLIVFMLDKSWSSQQFWPKSAQLVQWWPHILEQAERIAGGAAFRVPWRLTGGGRFEQIKL